MYNETIYIVIARSFVSTDNVMTQQEHVLSGHMNQKSALICAADWQGTYYRIGDKFLRWGTFAPDLRGYGDGARGERMWQSLHDHVRVECRVEQAIFVMENLQTDLLIAPDPIRPNDRRYVMLSPDLTPRDEE